MSNVKLQDLSTVEAEFYSTSFGEINDGSEKTQNVSNYPVIPDELKQYMDTIWQENAGCFLYMAKIKGQLGVLATVEFEPDKYEELLEKADELTRIKELNHATVYPGKHTGLKLLNDPAPKHELSLFMPIGTSRERLYEAVRYLCQTREADLEYESKWN